LEEAKKTECKINESGRSVEILEKKTGFVVERSGALPKASTLKEEDLRTER
jgi:hypothetical protein